MLTLSAPRALTFLVSLVLVALALATLYTRVPMIGGYVASHRAWFFVGGYAVLALGVLSRRL